MAKLTRLTGKVFGQTADATGQDPEIGQFGSAKAGTYVGTGDVAMIQALSAWSNGWIDAVTPNQQFPTLPEMTGVHKVLSYQEAYILQEGIPEWDDATAYYINSLCKYTEDNKTIIYKSIIDNNVDNVPSSLNGWEIYYSPSRIQSNYIPFCVNSGAMSSASAIEMQFIRPNLSANGTMGGNDFAVSASSAYNYPAWRAFDGSPTSYWGTSMQDSYTQSITFYNPIALNVTALDVVVYGWTNSVSTFGDNINVYGSDDNSTWTQLASNVASGTYTSYERKTVSIDLSSNTNSYKYYKIENTTCTYSSVYGIGWAIADVGITATYLDAYAGGDPNCLTASGTVITLAADTIFTNAFGTTYKNADATTLTLTTDGTYNIFASITDASLTAYTNTIYRQSTAPSSPSTNDVWLNTSVRPLSSWIYDGTSWNEFTDVPIGACVVSSGSITSVETFRYNYNGIYTPVIKTYINGTEGYRIWEDGFCEQWGFIAGNTGSSGTIMLLKEFADKDFLAYGIARSYAYLAEIEPTTTKSCSWYKSNAPTGMVWRVAGQLKKGEW